MGGVTFALNAIELVVFTTLAPSAAVAYAIVASRFLLRHADDRRHAVPVPCTALFVPLALVTAGFVVSATHLGNPGNALYVLNRVGQAGLSNEVFFTGLFLSLSGGFWIAALLRRPPKLLENLWVVATVAAAVAYLVSTSRVYCMPTVPTWGTPQAQAGLLLGALAGGPLLAGTCMALADRDPLGRRERRALLAGSAVGTVASCVALAWQWQVAAGMRNVFGSAGDFAPHYLAAVAVYGVGMLAACALVGRALARGGNGTSADTGAVGSGPAAGVPWSRRRRAIVLLAGVALMYAVTFLVRFQFYRMYLTLA